MHILCNNTNHPSVFFSISGNQHLKRVAVCNCESHAETLIRENFWPGTPKKTIVGFHFKLMDLAVVLFLHNQVPLRNFGCEKTVAKNSQSAFHMLLKKMTTQAGE